MVISQILNILNSSVTHKIKYRNESLAKIKHCKVVPGKNNPDIKMQQTKKSSQYIGGFVCFIVALHHSRQYFSHILKY